MIFQNSILWIVQRNLTRNKTLVDDSMKKSNTFYEYDTKILTSQEADTDGHQMSLLLQRTRFNQEHITFI